MAKKEAVALCAVLAGCSAEPPTQPAKNDSAERSAPGADPELVAAMDRESASERRDEPDPLDAEAPESPTGNPPGREGPFVSQRDDPELSSEPAPDRGEASDPEPDDDALPGSGTLQPVVPSVTGDCPAWRSGTITFRGLSGIQVVAGAKGGQPTAPMVFYWHGTGSTSGEFLLMANAVSEGVQAEGGIVVSFQGTTGGDLLSGTSTFGRGDIDLVDQLTACAVRDHNVDPRRIFTTGCSAGGLFAAALAVLRSDYVAAVAPNSGGLVFGQSFQGRYTPALMTMHGAPGRDVVVVDFSDTSRTADQLFASRGGFVVNCNHGGGHCGAAALAPDVWDFFLAHPYGVEPAPSPWASGLPAGFHPSCEIF